MRLLPCNQPVGTLESAPRTSLGGNGRDEQWEGFWCDADELYYARCVRADGSVQWYRVSDDEQPASAPAATEPVDDIRVIPLRRRQGKRGGMTGERMLLLWSGSGRSILVGTRAPRSRASGRRDGRRERH